ncbi:MAG: Crp/Fnr family transcriptional regulator, partial [Terracidiphilus sp.]
MANSFATSSNKVPTSTSGHPFPLQLTARPRLKIVPSPVRALPARESEFDMRSLLDKFMPGKTRRTYMAAETIYSQGDTGNAVFYIQSGNVKLTVVSTSGKEAVIAHLPAGSFFGEACMVTLQRRDSSASALQSSTIVRIDKTAMQALLDREPEFAQHFRAHLLARNIRMQADLVDHLFNSSEKRLARLLMLMANFGQESKPIPVIGKIS